jgi:hypothetical protein
VNDAGFHRVHLRSGDGDNVTLYVPLQEDGRIDEKGHRPWLLKARWGGYDWVGEFEVGRGKLNRLVWEGQDVPDSLTDFGTAPIKAGALVRIYEADDVSSDMYDFTVMDVRRV